MRAYLRAQRAWVTVERLPGYAPDLNPVELVRGNVKGRELANFYPDHLGEVKRELHAGLPPHPPLAHTGVRLFPDTPDFLFD